MAFDQNMIIDATRGSIARFVNHSCDPNCRMEKWTVGGKPRMALFAGDRGVMTGEELTYDYNFDPYSQKNVQICRCGSENCRGVLGPKPKDLPKEKEGKLAGAKRKIAEVLEESKETLLLNKKRKVEKEKPKLPKGWAYVEPVVKAKKDDGELVRQPSKLKKIISHGSGGSLKGKNSKGKRGAGQRAVSSSSVQGLVASAAKEDDADEEDEGTGDRPSSAVASLKAKAETFKKSVGRSLRGGR